MGLEGHTGRTSSLNLMTQKVAITLFTSMRLCIMQVKERTSNYNTYNTGSHVMEYGNKSIKGERVYLYQGFDPATKNFPANEIYSVKPRDVVNQRDADLLFLWQSVSSVLFYNLSIDIPNSVRRTSFTFVCFIDRKLFLPV